MNTKQLPVILQAIAIGFMAANSWAQADPAWLKAWNEAQQQRPKTLQSHARIAPKNEPGKPMIIKGVVVTPDDLPASGVIVHAYHRDHEGFELGHNDAALTTWELNGWAQTTADGEFEFETIRPAADHLQNEAAHIHFTLESRTYGRQWATKIFLSDDALISEGQRRQSEDAREYGAVRDIQMRDGIQYIEVAFRLKEKSDF